MTDHDFPITKTMPLLELGRLSPQQKLDGARVACDLAGLSYSESEDEPRGERYARWAAPRADRSEPVDGQEQIAASATTVLQALGLLPDDESVDRAPFQGVDRYVHGSRSSVERHRADHTALCGPCQRWVEVNDRKHKTGD